MTKTVCEVCKRPSKDDGGLEFPDHPIRYCRMCEHAYFSAGNPGLLRLWFLEALERCSVRKKEFEILGFVFPTVSQWTQYFGLGHALFPDTLGYGVLLAPGR